MAFYSWNASATTRHRRCAKAPRNIPGRGDGLGTGVDGVFRLRRVLGPVRHDAPLQRIEVALAGLGVTADDHRGLRRGDVPGRRDVRQRVHRAEEARNEFRRLGTGVSAEHYRSIISAPGWTPTARLRCGLPWFALPNASHRPALRINARHLLVMGNNLRAVCRMAPSYRAGEPPSYRPPRRGAGNAESPNCSSWRTGVTRSTNQRLPLATLNGGRRVTRAGTAESYSMLRTGALVREQPLSTRSSGSRVACPEPLDATLLGHSGRRSNGWSWPEAEWPVWSVQRQQADVRSWGLPTAGVDPKRR